MKQTTKKFFQLQQLNLPLLDPAASPGVPANKQKELNQALMELLLHAAQEEFPVSGNGGGDDE